jgi:hypothetical protein
MAAGQSPDGASAPSAVFASPDGGGGGGGGGGVGAACFTGGGLYAFGAGSSEPPQAAVKKIPHTNAKNEERIFASEAVKYSAIMANRPHSMNISIQESMTV